MPQASRHRVRGGYNPVVAVDRVYNSQDGSSFDRTTSDSVGQKDEMWDTVTRPFKPGRHLVNNAMLSTKSTRSHTPASGTSTLEYPGYYGYDRASGQKIHVRDAEFDRLLASVPGVDLNNLISQAATQALAGVRRPELSGLVSIAEMRSTVQSLLNPVRGALNFLSRNAPSKRSRRKRSGRRALGANLKDISDQHLTIIFGLMPFISDVQATLRALEAIEPVPIRYTSRGTASAHGRNSGSGQDLIYNDGNNLVHLIHNESVDKTVTVRAYQLYEASVSLTNALGLSVSDVPKALWQTQPLSFVVDWFANVGDYISALTPREGITYLTSGYSITTVTAAESSYDEVGSHTQPNGWVSEYRGGSQTRVVVAKQRVPTGLGSHVAITMKNNMHRDLLDAYKVTASISLLTQRLSKLL